MSRTENARSYLFSGLLRCGECGSRMVIISGQGKRGDAKYGCPSHRYRGVCSNALTIRRERLENQLLAAIELQILNSQLIEYTLQRFHDELRERLKEIDQAAATTHEQGHLREQLQAKAQRLADAVAENGHSTALLAKLRTIEAQIVEIDRQVAFSKPKDLSAVLDQAREFVYTTVLHLKELIHGAGAGFKAVLAQHIGQLILIPKQTPLGAVYEVSGGLQLQPTNKDVMQVVARDGVEPPTPAFSGLCHALF